jgi:hypothetical protein
MEKIDIKGINDNKLVLHQDGMLYFLCTFMETLQSGSIEDAYQIIMGFQSKYKKKELPIAYYREFNSECGYRIRMGNSYYILGECSESEFSYIDISYNYGIIKELFKLVSNLYFINKTR